MTATIRHFCVTNNIINRPLLKQTVTEIASKHWRDKFEVVDMRNPDTLWLTPEYKIRTLSEFALSPVFRGVDDLMAWYTKQSPISTLSLYCTFGIVSTVSAAIDVINVALAPFRSRMATIFAFPDGPTTVGCILTNRHNQPQVNIRDLNNVIGKVTGIGGLELKTAGVFIAAI